MPTHDVNICAKFDSNSSIKRRDIASPVILLSDNGRTDGQTDVRTVWRTDSPKTWCSPHSIVDRGMNSYSLGLRNPKMSYKISDFFCFYNTVLYMDFNAKFRKPSNWQICRGFISKRINFKIIYEYTWGSVCIKLVIVFAERRAWSGFVKKHSGSYFDEIISCTPLRIIQWLTLCKRYLMYIHKLFILLKRKEILQAVWATDLYEYSPDTVPPIHAVSYHVATDKPPPKMATSSGLF